MSPITVISCCPVNGDEAAAVAEGRDLSSRAGRESRSPGGHGGWDSAAGQTASASLALPPLVS